MKRNYTFLPASYALQRTWIRNAALLALAILLWLAAQFPLFIENRYSTHWYLVIAHIQRFITHWMPFSLGDLIYIGWGIALLTACYSLVKKLVTHAFTWPWFWLKLSRLVGKLLGLGVVFYLFWGLNYSRLGIAYQLQLNERPYTTGELDTLTGELLQKVNTTRLQLGRDTNYAYPGYRSVFTGTAAAYGKLAERFPFLTYRNPSIKRSLFSGVLTYMGYSGYYNPFSGEAQVNTKLPRFHLPYVTCHEVAHQLGYGDESEANFVGYLAAKASDDPAFTYSCYLDLFTYANGELYMRDSAAARSHYRALDTLVKIDLRAARRFFLQYKNPVEPVIHFFYGEYLKANHQPRGVDTYDAVTGWLLAYQRKYGEL